MIICLNGASSSGKSSIAKELQELLPGYVLNFSIDAILYALPPSALRRMTCGQASDGLNYGKLEDGFYAATRALADEGLDLIIDNAIVTERSAKRLLRHLEGLPVVMIGVTCDVTELSKREKERGDRTIGEAVTQVAQVHRHCLYDMTIDSTAKTPRTLAVEIQQFIDDRRQCAAFIEMKRRLISV